MAGWGAQLVQVSFFFLSPSDTLDVRTLFSSAFQIDADQTRTNKTPTPQLPFLSAASASAEDGYRVVQALPGRIDFLRTAPDPTESSRQQTLLAWEKELYALLTGVAQASFPMDVVRLALNIELLSYVPNYEEGARALYNSMGIEPIAEKASDLVFQINKRTTLTGHDNLAVNRIVQLSVVEIQKLIFTMPGQNTLTAPEVRYAARRQLDFNTVPSGRTFNAEQRAPILEALAEEIAKFQATGSIREMA